MYKNIGKKIKGLSYFLAWLIIAVCCFYAFYRAFLNEIDLKSIIISGCIIVGGCVFAYLFSWFIYGFGELIENGQKQIENLETILLLIDDIKKDNIKTQQTPKNESPLEKFELPSTREELFNSQLKKLKKDYEMSRITYDEYEEGKKKLEQKYR